MLIPHKGHTDTIQLYSVTVMTHVKALQAGHSSQGTSEPITLEQIWRLPQLLGQLAYLDYPGSVAQLAVEYDIGKSGMG